MYATCVKYITLLTKTNIEFVDFSLRNDEVKLI